MKKYGWQMQYPVDTSEKCNNFILNSWTFPYLHVTMACIFLLNIYCETKPSG